MAEIQYLLNPSHITIPGAHTAEVITNVPSGSISAVTVQNALNEIGNRNYAGSATPGGAANSAVKLETARTLTIGATGKAFDGSTNQSWSLAEIGAQANITAGTTSQYYRGDKTFQDFATSVREAILTGLNTSKLSSREVLSTDSLLSAIGLLQGQLTSIVEQNYYAQAGDAKLEIPLSYTGTGTGVLTLRLLSDIAQTATIDGSGKFYTDAAGTLNESTSFAMSANAWTTFYIKVPSGTCNVTIPNGYAIRAFGDSSNNLVGELANGPKINGLATTKIRQSVSSICVYTAQSISIVSGTTYPWLNATVVYFYGDSLTISGTTYPWLNATVVFFLGSSLTVSGTTYPWLNAVQVFFYGNSLTVSGTTYPWLNAVQVFFLGDSLTVSGTTYPWLNAAQVFFAGDSLTVSGTTYPWLNATVVFFSGSSLTVSGTTYPWLNAVQVFFAGDSLTISGTTYPWLNATLVYFNGSSLTISGTTYPWLNAVQVFFLGNSLTVSANLSTSALYAGTGDFDLYINSTGMAVSYPTTRAWPRNISRVFIRPETGSMVSEDVDRLFNDLDATAGLTAVGQKVLDLRGNCGAVTAASATARANLAAMGFTVSFNV